MKAKQRKKPQSGGPKQTPDMRKGPSVPSPNVRGTVNGPAASSNVVGKG